VEYRLLATAKAFREGSQMLVRKPQGRPLEILETIQGCFKKIREKEHLMGFWRQLKDNGTPSSELHSETSSHIKTLKDNVATIKHVADYMVDLKDNYSLDKTANPAPSFRANTGRHRLGQAFKRTREVISRLSECYETAIATFTFLEGEPSNNAIPSKSILTVEAGGLKLASLGRVAVNDEEFLYDGLVALIDLMLLRLASTTKETKEEFVPVINPVALLWWFEGEKSSYELTCEELRLPGFKSASKEIYSEETHTTIFRDIRKRLNSTWEIDAEDTENDSRGHSPGKSKTFILENAQNIA
jgi:hypothetical protein